MKISTSLEKEIVDSAMSFAEHFSDPEALAEEVIFALDLEDRYSDEDYEHMFQQIVKIIKKNVK